MAKALSVNGSMEISDAAKDAGAASLKLTNGDIILSNAKPQSISITQVKNALKQPMYNFLTNSCITANGCMTAAGSLEMTDPHITLQDESVNKPKAQNLTVKGAWCSCPRNQSDT